MNEKSILYKLVNDVGELKGAISQMDKKLDTITKNHDTRINDLEKTTDRFVGKASILGSIAGLIGGAIILAINYFIKK